MFQFDDEDREDMLGAMDSFFARLIELQQRNYVLALRDGYFPCHTATGGRRGDAVDWATSLRLPGARFATFSRN